MRRETRGLAAAIALVMLSFGSADAGMLTLTNWWAYGGSASVRARYQTGSQLYTQSGTYGVGSFAGSYEGTVTRPLYCLDVFHSFNHVPATWAVTAEVVPPDPALPPPWNTSEAAYAYMKWGRTLASETAKAAGVQLALWEISHEQNWRANFTATGWNIAKSGSASDFAANVSLGAGGMGWWATEVLKDVMANFQAGQRLVYYNPQIGNAEYSGKQGFVGQLDRGMVDVPEPTGLVLLGMALLTGAGITWRRRSRSR